MSDLNAERREARRRRLLESSESRMSKILNVEGEQRSEPGLEDGPFKSIKFAPVAPAVQSESTSTESIAPSLVGSRSFNADKGVPSTTRNNRLLVALLIAIVGVFVDHFIQPLHVAIPWIVYQVSIEVYAHFTNVTNSAYPAQGHFVNALQAAGVHPRAVMIGGRIAEACKRVLDDTVLFSVVFIAINAVLETIV